MLSPVYFDHEATIVTNEVEDVSPERYLSAEAKAVESMCSQGVPKLALGPCHLPSK
jgi:hypothetical protein